MAVDFGAKDGHDLNQVTTELLHRWPILGLVEDGDFDTEVVADLKDNFTPEPQESVFVGEEEFFDLALEQEQEELPEA